MNVVNVNDRKVGPGQPCFIVAEAGVNHNADVELAKQLVDGALAAGADAVKFQTWVTEQVIAPDAPTAEYQRRSLGAPQTQFEMAKGLELTHGDFREISAYARERRMLFFSTPDDEPSVDFLEELDVPLFKIGSAEVTNLPFLRYVARKGRPIILSTGMATLGEVETAVRAIEDTGNRQLVVLHCVSSYPADPAACNLRAMTTLASAFDYPVGFSDHTLGIMVPIAAVALGACVLEKHLTIDKRLPGPDHAASVEPTELRSMVQAIRTVERALGDGVKRPVPAEIEMKRIVRRALVTTTAIKAGETIAPEHLALRRTCGGLPAEYLSLVIGRRANRNLDANCVIMLEMLG